LIIKSFGNGFPALVLKKSQFLDGITAFPLTCHSGTVAPSILPTIISSCEIIFEFHTQRN